MKKAVSFLLTTLLVVIAIFSYSKASFAADNKQGILKNYSSGSVVIGVDGKNLTLTIDKATKFTQKGIPTTLEEGAHKGIKVSYRANGSKLLEMDFGEIGEQQQGVMELNTVYTRSMTSDTNTNVSFANSKKEEIGEEEDTVYGYDPSERSKVTIGSVSVIFDTLKVTLNGKELKVVNSDGKLDPATKGDEVQLVVDPDDADRLYLQFENELTEDATKTQEDIEKILSISYKKKLFKLTTSEIFKYSVDEDVYVEINGKENTLQKALNRSNYAYLILSPNNTIIYIDSFYKDLECSIKSVNGTSLVIGVTAKGKTPFTDTLVISPALTVTAASGEALNLSDIKSGDTVLVTVDPYESYKVTNIIKK